MTTFAQSRTIAELRFATRVLMRRHRTIPLTRHQPVYVPEWRTRLTARDFSGRLYADHGATGR